MTYSPSRPQPGGLKRVIVDSSTARNNALSQLTIPCLDSLKYLVINYFKK